MVQLYLKIGMIIVLMILTVTWQIFITRPLCVKLLNYRDHYQQLVDKLRSRCELFTVEEMKESKLARNYSTLVAAVAISVPQLSRYYSIDMNPFKRHNHTKLLIFLLRGEDVISRYQWHFKIIFSWCSMKFPRSNKRNLFLISGSRME